MHSPDSAKKNTDNTAASPEGVYLAFDYGERRIGIACGNTISGSVMPLCVVSNRSGTPHWEQIEAEVLRWQPVGLIIGDPLTVAGEIQEITRQARGFAKRAGKRFELPVYLVDERYSSLEADQQLKLRRRMGLQGKTRRADTDKLAATIVLQRWLDERS